MFLIRWYSSSVTILTTMFVYGIIYDIRIFRWSMTIFVFASLQGWGAPLIFSSVCSPWWGYHRHFFCLPIFTYSQLIPKRWCLKVNHLKKQNFSYYSLYLPFFCLIFVPLLFFFAPCKRYYSGIITIYGTI